MKSIYRIPVWVWIAVALYATVFISTCAIQYHYFLYTGYDLGIYNQVLWNTVHGHAYTYTFAPYSYLVDHREWLLMSIVPVYAIFQHPFTLLVIQTMVLAGAAIPLYWLSRVLFAQLPERSRTHWSILLVSVYLLNPVIQSMNLFEFHGIIFCIPLSFILWLCVLREHRIGVICSLIALLLVREDAAFMTAGIGLLLILLPQTRKQFVWIGVGTIIISIVWFLLMMAIGAVASPEHTTKFFYFYDYLGETPRQAIQYIVSHPVHTLNVMIGNDHGLVLFSLFSCVAFLPLLRPLYLLPAAGPLALYLLIDRSLFGALIKSHYSALIIPWLLIALIYALQALLEKRNTMHAQLIGITLVAWVSVHSVLLGPWWRFGAEVEHAAHANRNSYTQTLASIQPNERVMTTAGLYPQLSNRAQLYPVLHLLNGTEHYSTTPYTAPEHIDWLVLEYEELLRLDTYLDPENNRTSWERVEAVIEQNHIVPRILNERLIAFGPATNETIYSPVREQKNSLAYSVGQQITPNLLFDSWNVEQQSAQKNLQLAFTGATKPLDPDEHMRLNWLDSENTVLQQQLIPLGYGFAPTHSWSTHPGYTVVDIPFVAPQNATRLTITFGPIIQKESSLRTLLTYPIIDEAKSVTVDLTASLQTTP